VFGLLVALVLISTSAARRIDRERKQAEANARRSEQVAQFIGSMLWDARPDAAGGRDSTLLREMIERADLRLEAERKMDPRVEGELRRSFGATYFEWGFPDKAEDQFRKALRLNEQALGPAHPITRQTRFSLALTLRNEGKLEEFASVIQEVLDLHTRVEGTNNLEFANLLNNAALVARNRVTKLSLLRQSLSVLRNLGATNDLRMGITLENLASQLRFGSELTAAEPLAHAAVTICRLSSSDSFQTLNSERELCRLLWALGKFNEAETLLRRIARSYEQQFGRDHPWTAETLLDLSQFVRDRGDKTETGELLRRATDTALGWTNQPLSGPSGRVLSGVAFQWAAEAWHRREEGETPPARQAAREADRILQRLIQLQEESLPTKN
jgi:tetratricopeptide (TPR) repeat protein